MKVIDFLKTMNKKKLMLSAMLVAVIITLLVAVTIWLRSDKLNVALTIKHFDNVQVKISQSVKKIEITNDTDGNSIESDITDNKGEYGNIASKETYTNDANKQDTQKEVSVLKKHGNIIYEEGLGGKAYYYSRAGKELVMYYDDFYGIDEDNGTWTEVSAEEFNTAPSFDFNTLCDLNHGDFKKENNYYILKTQDDEVFYNILRVNNRDKYSACELKFWFSQGNLTRIIARYIYDNTYDVAQTYDFDYNNISLTIPKSGKVNK